jgi:hypothetical protein
VYTELPFCSHKTKKKTLASCGVEGISIPHHVWRFSGCQELSIESKVEISEHCESKLSFKLSSIQFFLLLNKEE